MLAATITAACLSGVLGNYGDTDKVSGVKSLVLTCYAASTCTGTPTKSDYKEVGACIQEEEDGVLKANEYSMGTANGTHYNSAKYTDNKCTTGSSEQSDIPFACTERDGKYCTGEMDNANVCTFYYAKYTKAGCATADFAGHGYHGGDLCEPEDAVNYSSSKRVCTSARKITQQYYASADCSGTPKTGLLFTSSEKSKTVPFVLGGGECDKSPVETEEGSQKADMWYVIWTSKSASSTTNSSGSSNETIAPTTAAGKATADGAAQSTWRAVACLAVLVPTIVL